MEHPSELAFYRAHGAGFVEQLNSLIDEGCDVSPEVEAIIAQDALPRSSRKASMLTGLGNL